MDWSVWCGAIGRLFGGLTKGFDERGDQRRGRTKRPMVTRGLGRFDFRRATPAKSKPISASIAVGMLALLILYAWLT